MNEKNQPVAQEAIGTFNCPICGKGTPHHHSDFEQVQAMSEEQIDAELRAQGIDPEAASQKVQQVIKECIDEYDRQLKSPLATSHAPQAEGILRKDAAHQLACIARKHGSASTHDRAGLMAAMRDAYLLGQQSAAPHPSQEAESSELEQLKQCIYAAGYAIVYMPDGTSCNPVRIILEDSNEERPKSPAYWVANRVKKLGCTYTEAQKEFHRRWPSDASQEVENLRMPTRDEVEAEQVTDEELAPLADKLLTRLAAAPPQPVSAEAGKGVESSIAQHVPQPNRCSLCGEWWGTSHCCPVDYRKSVSSTIPPSPSEPSEQNFCPRCGKRNGAGIHTCTPPGDGGSGEVSEADIVLPPLPPKEVLDSYMSHRRYEEIQVEGYTEEAMQEYARRAVLALAGSGGK